MAEELGQLDPAVDGRLGSVAPLRLVGALVAIGVRHRLHQVVRVVAEVEHEDAVDWPLSYGRPAD